MFSVVRQGSHGGIALSSGKLLTVNADQTHYGFAVCTAGLTAKVVMCVHKDLGHIYSSFMHTDHNWVIRQRQSSALKLFSALM
jgi:hypothetical protein